MRLSSDLFSKPTDFAILWDIAAPSTLRHDFLCSRVCNGALIVPAPSIRLPHSVTLDTGCDFLFILEDYSTLFENVANARPSLQFESKVAKNTAQLNFRPSNLLLAFLYKP
jgi:hypothetical protein